MIDFNYINCRAIINKIIKISTIKENYSARSPFRFTL